VKYALRKESEEEIGGYMPGNIVKINGSEDLQWYIGDSKMQKLIKHLNKLGHKQGSYKGSYKESKEEINGC